MGEPMLGLFIFKLIVEGVHIFNSLCVDVGQFIYLLLTVIQLGIEALNSIDTVPGFKKVCFKLLILDLEHLHLLLHSSHLSLQLGIGFTHRFRSVVR
mgnify:CR=1 FL=1